MLGRGETMGVFQLESEGMKRVCAELRPSRFEDIIALVALYRPGPMDWIPQYIGGKHGRSKPQYLHPTLEPILAETYGIAVYQEQVMQMARDIAGFTHERGRRAAQSHRQEAEREDPVLSGEVRRRRRRDVRDRSRLWRRSSSITSSRLPATASTRRTRRRTRGSRIRPRISRRIIRCNILRR